MSEAAVGSGMSRKRSGTGPERPGRRPRAEIMSLLDPTKVDQPLYDVDLAELAAVAAEREQLHE